MNAKVLCIFTSISYITATRPLSHSVEDLQAKTPIDSRSAAGGGGVDNNVQTGHAVGPLEDLTENTSAPTRAYATFIEGKAATEYAMVLLKSMQTLKHKYPNILLVREDSAMKSKIPAVQKKLQQYGWNANVRTFKPTDFKVDCIDSFNLKCVGKNWIEAWQRMALYKLDERKYSWFAHLDADTFAFQNLDHLLEGATMPTFARRFLGCDKPEQLDSMKPVTNFFIASPNARLYDRLVEYVTENSSHHSLLDEATVIPSVSDEYTMLGAEHLLNYECLQHFKDEDLHAHHAAMPDNIHVVHLGIGGRNETTRSRQSEDDMRQLVQEAKEQGYNFRANMIERWIDAFNSKDVQDITRAWTE